MSVSGDCVHEFHEPGVRERVLTCALCRTTRPKLRLRIDLSDWNAESTPAGYLISLLTHELEKRELAETLLHLSQQPRGSATVLLVIEQADPK